MSANIDIYTRFLRMRTQLRKYESKKDLLKAPTSFLKEYLLFIKFLNEDSRLRPDNQYKQFMKYNQSAIKFKSHYLGYDLFKHKAFDQHDRYKSSQKIIAIVTDAMIKTGGKLTDIRSNFEFIDIAYKKTARLKGISFDFESVSGESLRFIENMPKGFYINIEGTSYNKNGLDFVYDYFNQSSDFSQNLDKLVGNQKIFIYKKP